ncbi:SRPBCC family protein [Phenylobacterium sp.]|uniref:SRPBCC family protein n=1 Tax=Phenylobacterium sp. TaxID=1871053 RepID=UPI0035AEFA5A
MTERTVTHAMFTIERTFPAKPARVFKAFADPQAKAMWFGGPDDWDETERSLDFRVGGREVSAGGPPGGPLHRFDALYYEIIENERIIYAYEMHLGGVRISVSIATIELKPSGGGTRFVMTEQGAFLDGFDNPSLREEGTLQLVDALAASLQD